MRYLVTGGAGFAGFHLCSALLARGDSVVILDNLDPFYDPSEKLKNLSDLHALAAPGRLTFLQGDVRDEQVYARALAGVDGVFHLAALAGVRASARDPARYMDVNIRGTILLLSAMGHAGVKSAVFASSSSVYGEAPTPFSEAAPCFPLSPYGLTTFCAELLCAAHSHAWGAGIACARLFSLYGPRQRPDLVLRRFTSALLRGEPVELYGNGARDYTEISDAVAGLLRCMDWALRYDSCESFNLSGGRAVSTEELLSLLCKELAVAPRKLRLPRDPLDPLLTLANLEKSSAILGYTPKVPFEEGVQRFLSWMVPSA